MGTTFWPSAEDAELVEVEFIKLDGASRSLTLLVDSGFTGESSFVLGENAIDLIRADYDPVAVVGAVEGKRRRAFVKCSIPAMAFERTLISIITDISSLALPAGVNGLAGLSFLRQFARWGAESGEAGWQFYLSDEMNA